MMDVFELDSTGTELICSFDGTLNSLTDEHGNPLGPGTNTTTIIIGPVDGNGNPWTVLSATADPTISAQIANERAVWVAMAQAAISGGEQI
jgi:hypothetical protein